jgi:hypothetical protein
MLSQHSLTLAIQPFPNSHAQRSPAPPAPPHTTFCTALQAVLSISAGARHFFSLCVEANALETTPSVHLFGMHTATLHRAGRLHLVAAGLAAVLGQRRADLALECVRANDVVHPPGVAVELAEGHVLRAGRVLWEDGRHTRVRRSLTDVKQRTKAPRVT